MKKEIENVFRAAAELHTGMVALAPRLEAMLRDIVQRMRDGGTLYVMGNGGSAADAQHIAGELVGRFLEEREPIACMALTTDASVMTALLNDYGPEEVFARQVRAHAGAGDVVLGISTSGNSPNILRALEAAAELGALTAGLSGGDGGRMAALCDHCICVPHRHTPRIQEAHQTIIHILCEWIERELKSLSKKREISFE